MRHLKTGRKFGRTADQRRAFLRTLAYHLIMRERIQTTEARAKEIAPMAERLVTVAKANTLAARRRLAAHLPDAAAKRLIAIIAPRMAGRAGGYTRIIKLDPRKSDGARRALVEFVA